MSKNGNELKNQTEIILEIEYFRDLFNLINNSVVENLEFALGLQKSIGSLNIDDVGTFIESVIKVKSYYDEEVLPLVIEYESQSETYQLDSSGNLEKLEEFLAIFSQVHSEIVITFNQMQKQRKKLSASESSRTEESSKVERNSQVVSVESENVPKVDIRTNKEMDNHSSDKFDDIHKIGSEAGSFTSRYISDSADLVKDIKQKYRLEHSVLVLKIFVVELIFGLVVALILYKDFVIIIIGVLLMLIWINLVLLKKKSSIIALCDSYLNKYRNVS